jgi:hypothetical protein
LKAPTTPVMKAETISIIALSRVLGTPTTRVASSESCMARKASPVGLRRMAP